VNGFCWVNGFLFVRPTFQPAAVHPITVVASVSFWDNFFRAPTHPAGCSLFYTLLLFVRVFDAFVYGGPDCPARRFFAMATKYRHPSLSGVTRACPV
jgi:hypothetical protein